MAAPTPTSTARLDALPVARLLAHGLERRFTGTVVIEAPERHRSAIYFEQGAPAKVKSGLRVHLLGELLAELGLADGTAVEAALARAVAERRLLGQVLLADGRLTRSDLSTALREQLRRKICWMARLPGESVAGWYEDVNLLEKWGAREVFPEAPLPLLWTVVRDHSDPSSLDLALQRLGDRHLRLQAEAHPASFRFGREEQTLLEVMRMKPQSLAVLEGCGVLPRERVRQVVYVLGLTHQLDLGPGSPPPLGGDEAAVLRRATPQPGRSPSRATLTATHPTPAPRATPASRPPAERRDGDPARAEPAGGEATAAFAEEIRRRAAALSQQTHYQVLGVEPGADAAAIQGAFFQLAKRWHPDRLPGDLGHLRDLVTAVFSRMTEAHGALNDPARRAEYDRLLREGGATDAEQEKIKAVIAAAGAFQRAEILVKRQKLQEALMEARTAAEKDPEQVEHAALYAWIRGQLLDVANRGGFSELIGVLDRAVEKEPDNVRIRLYRAQILKRAGRADQAMRDYRHIVELQPHHTEAQRELRLHKMRRGDAGHSSSSHPPGGGKPAPRGASSTGLLGRLLKR